MNRTHALAVLVVVVNSLTVSGQSATVLVGTWERLSLTGASGSTNEVPGFLVFNENGRFVLVAMPLGRPKTTKDVRDLTREELLARFDGVQVRSGTYSVVGNTVVRKDQWNIDPNREGSEQVQEFRIEEEMLFLSTPGTKQAARFRRVK